MKRRWITMVTLSFGTLLLAWGLLVTTGRIRSLETKRARAEIEGRVQGADIASEAPTTATLPPFDFDQWEERFKEESDARLAMLRVMEPWTYEQLETFIDRVRERFMDRRSLGNYDYWAFRLMAEKDPAAAMDHYMTDADQVGVAGPHWDLFRITFYHFVEQDLDGATKWLTANHRSIHRDNQPQFAAVTLKWAETGDPGGLARWLQALRSNHVDLDFYELFYSTMFLVGDRHALHEQIMRFEDTEIREAADRGIVQATLEDVGFEAAAETIAEVGATGDREAALVKALVTGSANVAPESAADWLEANGTPDEIQTLLPDLVFLWAANQDHLSAERWVTARDPSPTRDVTLRSFAKGAATKDLELAIRTANLIEDLELREQALAEAHRMSGRRR